MFRALIVSLAYLCIVVSPIFASNSLKVIFKPFFFIDVNYHCVERNVKLLISA